MNTYQEMLSNYETLYSFGLCMKHHMHNSVLFINDEGAKGFEAIQFHNDGLDYRTLGHYPSLAEAFSSVSCYG